MRYHALYKISISFLIFASLSLLISGCTTGNGVIKTSQPKVWREDAIMQSTGRQIAELRKFEKEADLSAEQGKRLRSITQSLAIKADMSADLPLEGSENSNIPAIDDKEKGGKNLKNTAHKPEGTKEGLKEEPIDTLQRVDDFYSIAEGTVLAYLRDSQSQQAGYALYLLGFDISVIPGPATQKNYEGYLKFEIIPPGKGDDIKVFALSPQRYAERFGEGFLSQQIFNAGLKGSAERAKLAIDYMKQFGDAIDKLERYPIISGFIDGPHTFGWVFHPRPTIDMSSDNIEYSLETGIWHCYVLVLVKDGSVTAPKWIYNIREDDIKEKVGKKDCEWFEKLRKAYSKILNTVDKRDEQIEYIINKVNKNLSKDELEKTLKEEPDKTSDTITLLHKYVLEQIGRHGKSQNPFTPFNINVSGGWVRNDCKWYNRECTQNFEAISVLSNQPAQGSLTVDLPDKVDRTLEWIWPVMPNEAPGDKEVWVSIKGQGFGNDPHVFVGTQKALEILVISRDLILAKLPKYSPRDKTAPKECESIKVYSGGEAMVSKPNAFCHVPPYHLAPPLTSFRVIDISQLEGGGKTELRIKANMGVMDKIEKVIFDEKEIDKKSLSLADDNHTVKIVLPEKTVDKQGAKNIEIRLIFIKGTDIVNGDRYIVPFGFRYLD